MSYPWVNGSRDMSVRDSSFGTTSPAVEAKIKDLPHEITDEHIERDKAGHRGLFLEQLKGIWDRCDAGDPDDPRWDELRLRTLDRFAKLARIYEADAPGTKQGPGNPRDLARAAAEKLTELEESLRETRAS